MMRLEPWTGRLPELAGFSLWHWHSEGEPCWTYGTLGCNYRLTLGARIKRHLQIRVD